MDENNYEMEQAFQTSQMQNKPSRLRIVLRILTVTATLLVIALTVYLVVNRSRFNLDSFKRYLTYRALERSDEGLAPSFSIGQEDEVCYATLGDGVILCSENRIQLYSDGGVAYEDISTVMEAPVIQTCGNHGVVYDAGGNDLYLFADRQCVFHYASEAGYKLISARVNQNGWLAVSEQASGYKGTVTVYDAEHEPVITERISSQFVMDAVIDPDNRQVAVLTIGQDDITFVSTLSQYSLSDGAMTRSAAVSDQPVLDLTWDESGMWLQQEFGVVRLNNRLEQVSQWSDNGLHLQGYSLNGDGFALEYFSQDSAGTLGQLVCIDYDGNVVGTMHYSREVLSATAAGRYIAVLTSSQLFLYDSGFEQYAGLSNDSGLLAALVRSDGTAMLIGGEQAGVFLP